MSFGRRAVLLHSARLALGGLALGLPERSRSVELAADEPSWPDRFSRLRARYFLSALQRHPVVATYLGGSAVSPLLAESDGRLRDYRPEALADELREYGSLLDAIAAIPEGVLAGGDAVDRAVMAAQLAYRRRTLGDRRQYERAVDTYVIEPFRGIDLQLRDMEPSGGGGADAWELVARRVEAIPAFVNVARTNLLHGRMHGNEPDALIIRDEGVEGSRSMAAFYATHLVAQAREALSSGGSSAILRRRLEAAGARAGTAYEEFAHFLEEAFSDSGEDDRATVGREEYDWRLRHCLAVELSAPELSDLGEARTEERRRELLHVAEEIAVNRRLRLRFGTTGEQNASLHAVKRQLAREAPTSDDELLRWYRMSAARLQTYVCETGWFDPPSGGLLEIVPTPAALQGTVAAAYFPAPPLKRPGGVMFLSRVGDDPGALAENDRFTVASRLAHEACPGHHWHFSRMAQHVGEIPHIRWLTPGAIENSLSMWEDSMCTEGWASYAAGLMGESRPGLPHGAYSAEEHFHQLENDQLKAAGLHVDAGLHGGRMTRDSAVQWLSEKLGYLSRDEARRSVETRDGVYQRFHAQIARYAKWPTQGVTYALGRQAIEALRDQVQRRDGACFDLRRFHEAVLRMGTIPPGRFAHLLLAGGSGAGGERTDSREGRVKSPSASPDDR